MYQIIEQTGEVRGEYKTLEEALKEIGKYSKENPECFYRVEEKTKLIKTYQDACGVLGEDPLEGELVVCNEMVELINLPRYIEALLKLETITRALNEGWKPDWENKDQAKWGVYLDWRTGESKIVGQYVTSYVPTRFYFRTKELAEYSVETFKDLYRKLW